MRFFLVKSEDGKTWTELVKAAPWSARWGFGAAQLKEQLVIMGHLDEDNNVGMVSQGFEDAHVV